MSDGNDIDFRLRGARGTILGELRRGDRTVNGLAQAVGLTPNGVRLHLDRMAAEGLVETVGVERGVSKSSRVWGLSAAGRLVYSRAYGAFLAALVAELAARDADRAAAPARTPELFAAVARRLGPDEPSDALPRADRLRRALGMLRSLGGEPQVAEADGATEIALPHCPLSDVSALHPEVCEFGRALVAEWAGEPVAARCVRGERPRCRFALGA